MTTRSTVIVALCAVLIVVATVLPSVAAIKRQGGVMRTADPAMLRQRLSFDLLTAVRNRDVEAARRVLDEHGTGIDVDMRDPKHPLHPSILWYAAAIGDANVVSLLLKAGARPDGFDDVTSSPLHRAVGSGHWQVAAELIDAGANVNRPETETGYTPLHWAAYAGDIEISKLLLDNGADVHAEGRLDSFTPMFRAAMKGFSDIIQLLVKHKANPAHVGLMGATALHIAAKESHVRAVEELVKAGAPIDAQDLPHKRTPLMWAVALGNGEVVRVLLAKKASLTLVDAYNQRAHDLVTVPYINTMLIEAGSAPPQSPATRNETPSAAASTLLSSESSPSATVMVSEPTTHSTESTGHHQAKAEL